MPASAISQRLLTPGSHLAAANKLGKPPAVKGDAFSSLLDNLLNKTGSNQKDKKNEKNSGPAQALNQLLQHSVAGSQIALGGQLKLQELTDQTEKLKQQFHSSFRSLLNEQGIDLGAGVNLQVDAQGEIRVANDHPDKAFIEAALKNNPDLENQFKQIAANSGLLHAAKKSREFQQAYGIDPQKAIREYQHLLSKQNPPTYSLTITGEGIEDAFINPAVTADAPVN